MKKKCIEIVEVSTCNSKENKACIGIFEGLYSASCELSVASCELRVASCELRVASWFSIISIHSNFRF